MRRRSRSVFFLRELIPFTLLRRLVGLPAEQFRAMAETIAGHARLDAQSCRMIRCSKASNEKLVPSGTAISPSRTNRRAFASERLSRARGSTVRAVVGTLTEPRSCPRREKPNSESHPTSVRVATPCRSGIASTDNTSIGGNCGRTCGDTLEYRISAGSKPHWLCRRGA